ncbi:hypothetical protein BJ138DRAFT_97800 [Hygrophoropsis aurantiaca]|uniref:Uncharacterized protein n=1 Tax=Hygrophoropsis aurantiaca TaxID=72124 RepID=A0ACB7ZRD8_9AGAM|nr:hypothetical protein BJ138DRAFT_97800 [Hygrophoropsis aurantiaca]
MGMRMPAVGNAANAPRASPNLIRLIDHCLVPACVDSKPACVDSKPACVNCNSRPYPPIVIASTHPTRIAAMYQHPTARSDDACDTSTTGLRNRSLGMNYIPTKFSSGLLVPSPSFSSPSPSPSPNTVSRRKGGKGSLTRVLLPKLGGGREAFGSSEARMPASNDEDYDGVWLGKEGGTTLPRPRMRWNKFKWSLFASNTLLTAWSLTALIACLLTWFDVFEHADIVRVGNRTELAISTCAALLGVLSALIGWAGIVLNNRSFLAAYAFLLWVVFALAVAPGYTAYRRRTFNLEGKLNAQWSRALSVDGRLRIQNRLHCCGYYTPFEEAAVSQTCYARSVLPGCKQAYLAFERAVLERWYEVAFALVPLQLGIMVAALLCANHVTYRFGKGMMPKAYRLSAGSMAVIMDNYASQLAEQYGAEFKPEMLARSCSNLPYELTRPSANRGAYDSSRSGYDVSKSGYDVSKSGYDVSKSGYDVSKSGYDASKSGYDVSKSGYDVSKSGYDTKGAYDNLRARPGYESSHSSPNLNVPSHPYGK